MRGYRGIFKMTFISSLQYRASAWSGIITQVFFGCILIMVYNAFYSGGAESPMNFSSLATYIWLGQAFLLLVSLWFQDWDLCFTIIDGNVSYELVRPYNLYSFWFARLMARRASVVLLRVVPVLAFAALIPKPYGLSLPASLTGLLLSILSLLLAFFLATAISMFVYIFLFKIIACQGMITILAVVSSFFSGGIIPIPLMPDYMYKIVNILPFRYLGDFPFRVYTGGIGTNEAILGVLIQIIWILSLMVIGNYVFAKFLRKVIIQGG